MIRYPTAKEVLELGRAATLRDAVVIESTLEQVQATFGGKELYPTLLDKVSFLCVSLLQGRPFADRNEEVAHAVMERFLGDNHARLEASPEERHDILNAVGSGRMTRRELFEWLRERVQPAD